LRVALVLATVIPAAALLWLRPLGADEMALNALADGHGVDVRSTPLVVRMDPDQPKGTGLVFYPGAKVDPRAYARILRPVAEAGYTVVIIKLPFNLAVLSPDAASVVVGDTGDDINRWVVGGHSLGGVMAATFASSDHDELSGLLLYAAYPSQSIADRIALDVLSVYGTNDGLATVADIDASKADLPPDTRFVPIVGGIHAYFGDYGPQSGDGTATITREDAQAQIAAATIAQMDRVDAAG
jgi:pimeloyl-ACP methyl ester carboxylesterase